LETLIVPSRSRSAFPSSPSISASVNAPWPQAADSWEFSRPCYEAKITTPFSILANSLMMLFMSTAPVVGPTLGGRVFFVWFGDHEQTLT
jgi:hypothetical protein